MFVSKEKEILKGAAPLKINEIFTSFFPYFFDFNTTRISRLTAIVFSKLLAVSQTLLVRSEQNRIFLFGKIREAFSTFTNVKVWTCISVRSHAREAMTKDMNKTHFTSKY